MTHPGKISRWLVPALVTLAGALVIGLFAFNKMCGTTPENELTVVEGVPSEIEVTEIEGRYGSVTYVSSFRLGGYHTEYSSSSPNYRELQDALKSGKPIKVWVSTKRETIFPRHDYVPLYKMSVGNRSIISYIDTMKHDEDGATAAVIVGCTLMGAGLFSLVLTRLRK